MSIKFGVNNIEISVEFELFDKIWTLFSVKEIRSNSTCSLPCPWRLLKSVILKSIKTNWSWQSSLLCNHVSTKCYKMYVDLAWIFTHFVFVQSETSLMPTSRFCWYIENVLFNVLWCLPQSTVKILSAMFCKSSHGYKQILIFTFERGRNNEIVQNFEIEFLIIFDIRLNIKPTKHEIEKCLLVFLI